MVNLAYRPQRGAAQIWSTQTQGHPTWNRTVTSEWETATLDIVDRLQIDPGSQVLYRVKHQQRGRGVAQVHEAWIPTDLVTMIQQTIGEDYASVEHPPERDLYTMLRECGQAPVEVTEDVLTRMPDPEEVDTLQLPPGVPVLVTYRITRDKNGRPVETSTFTGAGDRITLSYTVPLEASVSAATQEESGPVQRDPQDVLDR